MGGICIHCGKQMKWPGHIWLFCEHCGGGQVWPLSSESEEEE